MAVDTILSRLAKVRSTGKSSWLACCPAHNDKTPSLTVRALDDGRILVHCFSGCGAVDVVGAIGLEMTDLFPERLGEFKPVSQPFSAMDALRALRRESGVLAIAVAHVAEGKPLNSEHKARIDLCAERIADAAGYVHALG
ncbi:MAG TPA: CHC2 zinc finger domain-containing protein [Acidobacteriaceae bacterium]|jgi:hypothetical protein